MVSRATTRLPSRRKRSWSPAGLVGEQPKQPPSSGKVSSTSSGTGTVRNAMPRSDGWRQPRQVRGRPAWRARERLLRGSSLLLQPALDVRHERAEVVEPPEPRVDALEVDIGVFVHEDVAKAGETFQACCGLRRQDASGEEALRDVPVFVHGFLELGREDVSPRVEEGLGGDLQAPLDGPAELLVRLELLDRNRSPRTQVTRGFVDLEKLPPDDVRLDRHDVPAGASRDTCAGSF